MRNFIIYLLSFTMLFAFTGGFTQPSEYEGKTVRKIEFKGTTNVDEDDLADIIITEVSLLGLSGIDGIHLIRRQDKTAKIIVVSFKHDFDVIKRAFKTGANGYLTKPISDERLSQALKAVMNDGAALSHDVAKKVITMFQQKRYPQLSKRENQIAEYLGQGETYKGIAKKLFVTPSTVNFHIQNIYLKLNVNSKSEALQKLRLLMAS